jgi:protein-L-isoaspartate(D-aspartate) O-methyltransferase
MLLLSSYLFRVTFVNRVKVVNMSYCATNAREEMVHSQIFERGIKTPKLLSALRTVPRHEFVPAEMKESAYEDHPISIGYNQTISQPYIVALMTEAAKLQATDKVLEIGTGCGYAAAVASLLAKDVYTSEIIPELGNEAKERLSRLNYNNVHVLVEDGSTGFSAFKPYDAIIVTAAAPSIPLNLLYQLSVGGRLIIPVHNKEDIFFNSENLLRLTRTDAADSLSSFSEEKLEEVRFVPLTGKAGWK